MHPIAIQLGPLTIHWYGILVAIGFLLGFWTAGRRSLRDGISSDKIMDMAPWLLFSAVIGARVLHVVSYWQEDFAHKPFTEIFMVQRGGLVFYGGFIGASLATIIYARVRKISLWKLADALAPSIALGHAFGRLGCLMTGCCYGGKCEMPWAIRFPVGHETHPVGFEAMPVHPTQIYEALLNFALYGLLAWFHRRKRFDGQIFSIYLVCYAVLRSVVEVFRADYRPSQYVFGAISPGQLISIFLLATAAYLFWKLPKQSANIASKAGK